MTTIVDKIRKRIKDRQILEGRIIEEIQVTKEEAKQLGDRKEIDSVRLIVVDKLGDIAKTDCFAYMNRNGHRGCYCLNKLYCINENCNFYKSKLDINITELETSIKEYSKGKGGSY